MLQEEWKAFQQEETHYIEKEPSQSLKGSLFIKMAISEIESDNLSKARALLRKAVSFDDQSDKAWLGLALIHKEFDDKDLALANALLALDLNPVNETAFRLVFELSLHLDKPEMALKCLKKSNKLAQKYDSLVKKLSKIHV